MSVELQEPNSNELSHMDVIYIIADYDNLDDMRHEERTLK